MTHYNLLINLTLSISILFGCQYIKKCELKLPKDKRQVEQQKNEVNYSLKDTLVKENLIQIGNSKALLKVLKINKIGASDWFVELHQNNKENFQVSIDKKTIIDLLRIDQKNDFTNRLTIDDFEIKYIQYKKIRANSLYFKICLKNKVDNNLIYGRFNLFYQTKRKGEIYGWITDEIEEISQKEN